MKSEAAFLSLAAELQSHILSFLPCCTSVCNSSTSITAFEFVSGDCTACFASNSTSFAIITFFCCHHISQFPYVNDVMRGSEVPSNCCRW
ncbi:hypothetical protein M405DRAFT_304388 [Rhizopogon salebrosus TDB-379]|nr:hypothetical protein M405DRAFT_304388 [Rhizopogon salebrosus TDB-379]